ncbi:Ger(x)C family spore germination protein [Paenibacillus alba]|uniref:Ger(X)C family spore germination protein n=1 Tax=Paenibacillus alba TaxID=1197127 RepID=A0ABU6FY43_9BACL|nr:Ger(x)C family spore germination protein [Paenibacillus alba]MEC0226832.1 Ger(x)C family spore germination protein [Paenibacillus alba]
MKKLVIILILICLCSACGFKDIDRRFFVVAIGIDKSEKKDTKYRLTLKLAVPGNNIDMGTAKFELVTQDGNSITDCVRLLKSKVDKELDFGHSKIAIFGQSLLKENISETTDWLNRRRDIQLVSWLAAGSPSAEAVLGTEVAHERLPGNALLLSFGKTGVESGYIISEYLFDFYRKKKELGLDPIIPIIQASNKHYTINTSLVFDKERSKLALNMDETRLFNIMKGNLNKVEIATPYHDSKFFISVDNLRSKYRVYAPSNQRPYANIDIRMRGVIEETFTHLDANELAAYENAVEKTHSEAMSKLLVKFQKENLDPMGFGLNYRAHHFGKVEEEWHTWQALYPELEFHVNIQMKLEGIGVIK